MPGMGSTASGSDTVGMAGMAGRPGDSLEAPSGRMIVPMMRKPMMPGLEGMRPAGGELVPGAGRVMAQLPTAMPSTELRPKDGDTITLAATIVRRTIAGRTLAAYAFNGETPGPLIRVTQGTTFFVRFANTIDLPATIHWHGVRLGNAFDGSTMTQSPVPPGGTFVYVVHCPDAGIFWYHDHIREDIGQPWGCTAISTSSERRQRDTVPSAVCCSSS